MENLRWILILAGVAILVLLYFSGRPRRSANREARSAAMDRDDFSGQRMGGRADDIDPLLGEQPMADQYGAFDDVDPDDFVRPASQSAPQDYPGELTNDYGFDEPEPREAGGSGLGNFAQKIEAFSERLSPKRRQRIAESEPADLDEEAARDPAYASKIVTLHVVAPPNQLIAGDHLLDLFERRGYHYGEMNIFHSMHDGTTVFSIAKMIEPGYFDINNIESFQTPGITLILQLPGPVPADVAFEVLVSEAFEMGNELGATVLDEHRSTLTKQTVQHMREGIYEYMHRQKYFGSVPS